MSSEAVQSILSRIEIESLLARYNRSLDRLDEEGLRASFHPDATVYMGGEPGAKRADVPVSSRTSPTPCVATGCWRRSRRLRVAGSPSTSAERQVLDDIRAAARSASLEPKELT